MNKKEKVQQNSGLSKAVSRAVKKIGNLTKDELDSMYETDLKARIVQASQAMKEVEEELENNEKYQSLKESLAAMSQGKKEVDARQKAVIKYCLHRMEELGKDPSLVAVVNKKKAAALEKALDNDGIKAEVTVNGK